MYSDPTQITFLGGSAHSLSNEKLVYMCLHGASLCVYMVPLCVSTWSQYKRQCLTTQYHHLNSILTLYCVQVVNTHTTTSGNDTTCLYVSCFSHRHTQYCFRHTCKVQHGQVIQCWQKSTHNSFQLCTPGFTLQYQNYPSISFVHNFPSFVSLTIGHCIGLVPRLIPSLHHIL